VAHYARPRKFFESERNKRRRRAPREQLPPVRYGEVLRDTDLRLCDTLAERGGDRRGLLRALRRADDDE
jgi:hypothetical protein